MAITESLTIALDGELPALFRELERQEADLKATAERQLRAIGDRRNAMVTALLAHHGYLQAVQDTPGVTLDVSAEGGLVIAVPNPELSDG